MHNTKGVTFLTDNLWKLIRGEDFVILESDNLWWNVCQPNVQLHVLLKIRFSISELWTWQFLWHTSALNMLISFKSFLCLYILFSCLGNVDFVEIIKFLFIGENIKKIIVSFLGFFFCGAQRFNFMPTKRIVSKGEFFH